MQEILDAINNLFAVDFFVYLGIMGVLGLFLGSWIAEDETPWKKMTVILIIFLVLEQLAIRAVNPSEGHTARAVAANILFFGIYFGCIALGAWIMTPFIQRRKVLEKRLEDCLDKLKKGEISDDDFIGIVSDNLTDASGGKPSSPC